MKKNKLSVALATFNEEANLKDCLDSVKKIANEIIVVDGGSTDKTRDIARSFNAKIIKTSNPSIFHINKQKAVDSASSDWILVLDADERLTGKLRKEIVETISDQQSVTNNQLNGYNIARKNIFCGKWLKYGGLYPDYVIRLFKKGKGTHPCKSVHEQIEIDGAVGYLKEPMIHNTYPTFAHYMAKADTYTSLEAQEMIARNVKNNLWTILKYVLFKPIHRFLLLYLRHKAILEGWWGFVWSLMSALRFPMAYIKYVAMINS